MIGDNTLIVRLNGKAGPDPNIIQDTRIIRKAPDGRQTEIKVAMRRLLAEGRPEFDHELHHGDTVLFWEPLVAICASLVR